MQAQRILVVDDESSIREIIRKRLLQDGHDVRTAADGVDALEAFRKSRFDVVMTDLKMPRMGGVELVERVKETAPGTITIVLTGHATPASAAKLLQQGCDSYLQKPLPGLDLVSHAVSRCLDLRNARMTVMSIRRTYETKDEVLKITCGEGLAEIGDRLRQLEEANIRCDWEGAAELIGDLSGLLARFGETVAEVEKMPGREDMAAG